MKFNSLEANLPRAVRRKQITFKKDKYYFRTSCLFCDRVRGLIRKYDLYTCRNCFKENATQLGFSTYYQ